MSSRRADFPLSPCEAIQEHAVSGSHLDSREYLSVVGQLGVYQRKNMVTL